MIDCGEGYGVLHREEGDWGVKVAWLVHYRNQDVAKSDLVVMLSVVEAVCKQDLI